MVWTAAETLLDLAVKHCETCEVIDGKKKNRLTIRRNLGGTSVTIEQEGYIRERSKRV